MDAIVGIPLNQQRDRIRHDFHPDDLHGTLCGDLVNDGLQPFVHALCQDPTPVLRAPDDMIFSREYHIVVGFVDHTLIIWPNAV